MGAHFHQFVVWIYYILIVSINGQQNKATGQGRWLNIFDHLPDPARANAHAKAAADALGFVHHVLIGPVRELPACDGTIVARLFAHAAVLVHNTSYGRILSRLLASSLL